MKNTADLRLARPRPDAKKFLRVAGLPAVAAATAPGRVEMLFFDQGARSLVRAFCAVLARARKPYRLVGSEEFARVAGTILHGGVVALTQPRPISPFDPDRAAAWARDGRLLLLLDGVGNPHNFGAIARTAASSPRVASNMSSSIVGCASSRLPESCVAAMWWSAPRPKAVSRSQRCGDRSAHSPWCWVTKRRDSGLRPSTYSSRSSRSLGQGRSNRSTWPTLGLWCVVRI
jgi:hypothetical protein